MTGQPLLLHLSGAKGRLDGYRFTPDPPGAATWAVTVTRDGGGEPYRVALGRDGVMRCGCKDFFFRRRGDASGCKHTRRARELYDFWAALKETTTMDDQVKGVVEALAAHFPPEVLKFRPGVIAGSRALALAYVDARDVQDRLDAVLGVDGWQDQYVFLPEGSVVCTLRVKLRGEWITKMDVGGQSEQPDEGDRVKASVSDALKRAAVKFGVGRYLYRLPAQWCDYDPQKRRFTRRPVLAGVAPPEPPAAPNPDAEPSPGADGEAFEKCKAALKAAADAVLLRRYKKAYGMRGFTQAQVKELDGIFTDRLNALGGRQAAPAGKAAGKAAGKKP